MEKNREVQSNNNGHQNIKTIQFQNLVRIETVVLKANHLARNNYKYDLDTCSLMCQDINLMQHEIHTDADEKGASGIIIGRTISASLDEKGRLTIIADIEQSALGDKKVEDFTLITVGIGSTRKFDQSRVLQQYHLSAFAICLKSESTFYNCDGIFID